MGNIFLKRRSLYMFYYWCNRTLPEAEFRYQMADAALKNNVIADEDLTKIGKEKNDAFKELLAYKSFLAELTDVVRDRLRSPVFIYNLLDKYGGQKHCALCECKIESIVQAAHIYQVSQIRRNELLNDEEKFRLAVDRDNGIWLCENHHKLFDRGLIWFEDGLLKISSQIDKEDFHFVKKITNNEEIIPPYLTERMLAFFDMRAGIPPRILV